jgi:fumarylacetoacetase
MASPDYADHFSLANIPFGIASAKGHTESQPVSRIENTVIFLQELVKGNIFQHVEGLPDGIFAQPTLNSFSALDRSTVNAVRHAIQDLYKRKLLPAGSTANIADVQLHLPITVAEFTDFSCSENHVLNMGRIMGGKAVAPPGFYHYPTCYGGRGASVVVSGTPIERPVGTFYDLTAAERPPPVAFGPSRSMDFELELAAVVGKSLSFQKRLKAVDADEHIFGFVLLNDWSARDIQALEMAPLGPCLGKNLGTTISPWIVTLDALEPFRVHGMQKKHAVRPYLDDPQNWTYDITMEADLLPAIAEEQVTRLTTSNVTDLYWTPRQMLSHIVSTGSPLRTGDLMATGTVSGTESGTRGCLAEATEGSREPLTLEGGDKLASLRDGDTVRMIAYCGSGVGDGSGLGVGFGECVGQLVPARAWE